MDASASTRESSRCEICSKRNVDFCTTSKKGNLPGFDELSHDPGSQQFLVSLSADVLKAGINEDHETVGKLVSVLLLHDQRAALAIGELNLLETNCHRKCGPSGALPFS